MQTLQLQPDPVAMPVPSPSKFKEIIPSVSRSFCDNLRQVLRAFPELVYSWFSAEYRSSTEFTDEYAAKLRAIVCREENICRDVIPDGGVEPEVPEDRQGPNSKLGWIIEASNGQDEWGIYISFGAAPVGPDGPYTILRSKSGFYRDAVAVGTTTGHYYLDEEVPPDGVYTYWVQTRTPGGDVIATSRYATGFSIAVRQPPGLTLNDLLGNYRVPSGYQIPTDESSWRGAAMSGSFDLAFFLRLNLSNRTQRQSAIYTDWLTSLVGLVEDVIRDKSPGSWVPYVRWRLPPERTPWLVGRVYFIPQTTFRVTESLRTQEIIEPTFYENRIDFQLAQGHEATYALLVDLHGNPLRNVFDPWAQSDVLASQCVAGSTTGHFIVPDSFEGWLAVVLENYRGYNAPENWFRFAWPRTPP